MPSDFLTRIRTIGRFRQYPCLTYIGQETRISPSYRCEGRKRGDNPHCLFQYTLEGEGIFRDGKKEHSVPAGRGFLSESNDPAIAYYYPPSATQPWKFVFMDFIGALGYVMAREIIAHYGRIYALSAAHPALLKLQAFRDRDKATGYTGNISPTTFKHYSAAAICTLMVSESGRVVLDILSALVESKEFQQRDQPCHRLVQSAQEQIQRDIQTRLRAGDVAKSLNVSREHLTRVFRQETGQSLYRYISVEKMLHACGLLQDGSMSVKQVSHQVGFADPAHFARAFQRVMHMTPGAFQSHGDRPFITD